MKRFFTYLKTELKLSLRDMNMPTFAIIMPLVIFIILGVIYGIKPAYDGADCRSGRGRPTETGNFSSCGFAVSFLDFSKVSEGSALTDCISNSISTGSLGESSSVLMNFVPRSYRVWRTPQDAYDAMIFVANATPIEIKSVNK